MKIKIKKENKGKFTDYCGGKVTNECIAKGKKSKNPTIRKRATFALNARAWKHLLGGSITNIPFDIYIRLFLIGGAVSNEDKEIIEYKIKPGDTLSEIAEKFEMGLSELQNINNINSPDNIFSGQVIKVLKSKPRIHVVEPGNNLSTISETYQVPMEQIMKANNISDADLILIGDSLVIPKSINNVLTVKPEVIEYIVKSGDTLENIALNNNSKVNLITEKNNINRNSIINVGQKLLLPQRQEFIYTDKDKELVNAVAEILWKDELNPSDWDKQYFKYLKSAEGGDPTIGPGLKTLTNKQKLYIKDHNGVVSREVLNSWLIESLVNAVRNLKEEFTSEGWDKIPDRYRMGMLDMRHQLGSLYKLPKFLKAIRNNDLNGIINESKLTWKDTKGIEHYDERRHGLRVKHYFYKNGGKLNYLNLFL